MVFDVIFSCCKVLSGIHLEDEQDQKNSVWDLKYIRYVSTVWCELIIPLFVVIHGRPLEEQGPSGTGVGCSVCLWGRALCHNDSSKGKPDTHLTAQHDFLSYMGLHASLLILAGREYEEESLPRSSAIWPRSSCAQWSCQHLRFWLHQCIHNCELLTMDFSLINSEIYFLTKSWLKISWPT